MDKAIVLLSGGMDSAVALYWAAERYEIAAVMNFDYGQHGAQAELQSATAVLGSLKAYDALRAPDEHEIVPDHLGILKVRIRVPIVSALTSDRSLDPNDKDRYGQPMTFVPGRNLIFIGYATAVAYDLNAKYIIGGWSGVDVDYPDCSRIFLREVSLAAALAIGRGPGEDALTVMSPVSGMSKAETVALGERLGVPWGLTRSCYAGDDEPCMFCDSCLVRIKAFIKAGVRDPLVADDGATWDAMVVQWTAQNHARIYGGQDEPTGE